MCFTTKILCVFLIIPTSIQMHNSCFLCVARHSLCVTKRIQYFRNFLLSMTSLNNPLHALTVQKTAVDFNWLSPLSWTCINLFILLSLIILSSPILLTIYYKSVMWESAQV
jgi:hypothetical protein